MVRFIEDLRYVLLLAAQMVQLLKNGESTMGGVLDADSGSDRGSYIDILDDGSERGSYIDIECGKVFVTLVVVADARKVADAASRSYDLILEVTCRGGGFSGV